MGEKMKNIAKKVLISVCIIFTIFSPFAQIVRAEEPAGISQDELNGLNNFEYSMGSILDGIAGVGTVWLRGIGYAFISALNVVLSTLFRIGGIGSLENWGGTNPPDRPLDISDILFADANGNSGGVKITSVDFFNIGDPGNGNTIMVLRQNIANWYYSFRNLAIVALLLILLYVGIRMALATVGEEEAKYKKMLKDWATSLVLVFVMQYLMIFIIEINKVLVTILYKAMINDRVTWYGGIRNLFGNGSTWDNYMTEIGANVFHWSFTVGWSSLIIYSIMIGITFIFLFNYIKRMITVGFLIMISPLITITYSIDKMKDGKSQALDTWLKEFTYNVLINPFHCIVYMVFVTISLGLMENARSIGSAVLAVIMITFIFKAEDIVKKIFNFQSSSLQSVISSAAAIGTGLKVANMIGGKGVKKSPDSTDIPDFEKNDKGVQIGDGNDNTRRQSNVAQENTNAATSASGTQETQNNPQQTSTDSQSPEVANGENNVEAPEISAPERKKKTAYQRFGDFAKNNAGKVVAGAAIYPVIAGLGLSIGSFEGFTAGLAAADSTTKGIMGLSNRRKVNKVVQNREDKFANAYEKYRQKSGLDEEQMKQKTALLLDAKKEDEDKMSDAEYEYYTYVKQMKNIYNTVDKDSGDDRVMNLVGQIQNDEIKPDEAAIAQQIEFERLQAEQAEAAQKAQEQADAEAEKQANQERLENIYNNSKSYGDNYINRLMDYLNNGEISEEEYKNLLDRFDENKS